MEVERSRKERVGREDVEEEEKKRKMRRDRKEDKRRRKNGRRGSSRRRGEVEKTTVKKRRRQRRRQGAGGGREKTAGRSRDLWLRGAATQRWPLWDGAGGRASTDDLSLTPPSCLLRSLLTGEHSRKLAGKGGHWCRADRSPSWSTLLG